MIPARRLAGLPGTGPAPLSFPTADAFREGLVVEFTVPGGGAWIGNFEEQDAHGYSGVWTDLGPKAVVVVAGGAGYLVDAVKRRLIRELGSRIQHAWFEPELSAMVVSNGLWFEAFDGDRVLWSSRRLSWDRMRDLKRSDLVVAGEAYTPVTDEWLAFRLDLSTGTVEGGSYDGED
jgi:hypothetical protein